VSLTPETYLAPGKVVSTSGTVGTYASLPVPERIEVPVTPASGPYYRFCPREIVRRPAKTNLYMVEKLVGLVLVSSRGDLILDPFAGTFSTCVPAVMMDREAGGVEMSRSIWAGALRFRKGLGEQEGPSTPYCPVPENRPAPSPSLHRCGRHKPSVYPYFATCWRS
jgi:hypothetical protein